MRHLTVILISLVTTIALCSCEKETILSVDKTDLTFSADGGSSTFLLTANKEWISSSDQPWCTISPKEGANASETAIEIRCEANCDFDERRATVTIRCKESMVSILIIQAGASGLIVQNTVYDLTFEQQSLQVEVEANVDYDVFCEADWIVFKGISEVKGMEHSQITLEISRNDTFLNRESEVVIQPKAGPENLGKTVVIKQATSDKPGLIAVSLLKDFEKDGVIVFPMNTGGSETRVAIQDGPVFFFTQGENVDMLYYNHSVESALSDARKDAVITYHNRAENVWTIFIQDNRLIFKKVDENTYNMAFLGEDGNASYYHGLVIQEEDWNESPYDAQTRTYTQDMWIIHVSALLKLASFAITACSVVTPLGIAGITSTMITEAMKSDFFNMKTLLGEDRIFLLESSALIFQNVAEWDPWSQLAFELNGMADALLDQVGELEDDIVPELGYEWNIKLDPRFLRCPNVDAQYKVHVSSKALWELDDSTVDESWCSVQRWGDDDLIVTIRQNPNPGVHSCYATIKQAYYGDIHHITPAILSIELFSDVTFYLSPTELIFTGQGGSKEVKVIKSDNIIGWHVDKNTVPKWCTVSNAGDSFFVNAAPSSTGHVSESIAVYGAIDEDTFFKSEVSVSMHLNKEDILRQKLIQFYKDTGGPNWINNENWCSDKPIDQWHGVRKSYGYNGAYDIDLQNNNLTGSGSLDHSPLYMVNLTGNNLTSLDFSDCDLLVELVCQCNNLGSISVKGCINLDKLDVSQTRLGALDVSGLEELSTLYCSQNDNLSSLNLQGCNTIFSLSCAYCPSLTSLDVSHCTGMYALFCHDTGLLSLDLPDDCPLEYFSVMNTPLIKEIPPLFDRIRVLYYDKRYSYYGKDEEGNLIYEDKGYGWYYPGEPEKGYHGW